jgi:hypothetical protein
MRFADDDLDYLRGNKYINALPITFELDEEDHRYRTQIDLLCELVKDKKIIHVGCLDHNIETVKHKLKRKKWLHSRLCKSASRCHGIDIEKEGIEFIREKLGYHDTSCANIFSDEFVSFIGKDTWDYLLIPEVLEHMDEPSGFLRAVGEKYGGTFSKIIITVPNGISQDNWKFARKGMEVINSDHCFWFTPYTLAKTVINAGLSVEEIRMCRHGTINWRSFLKKRFFKKYPLLRNDILCIAASSPHFS